MTPSLASNGIMNTTSKSDLIGCFQNVVPFEETMPTVDAKVVDGAELIQTLDPKKSISHALVNTFQDYADHIFIPSIQNMLEQVVRLDVVWDTYRTDSLKAQTRQNRGSGTPMKVDNQSRLPVNWKNFLRCDENKESLFKLLAIAIEKFQFPPNKQVISSFGAKSLSSPVKTDISELYCSQEEADTRLIFHAKNISDTGLKKILIQATDTDVVVIAIAMSKILNCELWIAFGHGSKVRYIPCHIINSKLGNMLSKSLLFFHAFTGCDVCSSFHGIGKRTVWSVFNNMPNIHELFVEITDSPDSVSPEAFEVIERFTVLLYQKTSGLTSVNELRKYISSQCRNIESIPPTKKPLEQKVKRACYVAGCI